MTWRIGLFCLLAPLAWGGEREVVDLLVLHGLVVTVDEDRGIIEDGALAIDQGGIVAVGTTAAILDRFLGRSALDARDHLVLPGLVNTHNHVPMTLMRGLSDDLPLKEWLEEHIWPAEAKVINAQTVTAGTELAAVEMIRSGTTTFNDMYFFADEIASVADRAGLRALVGETIIDFPTPNKKTPQETIQYTKALIAKWRNHPRVSVAVAAHSPYTVAPELLKAAKALAVEHGLNLHVHLSETQTEVNTIRQRYGLTPTEHLHSLGVLFDGLTAAHCVVLSERDRDLLVRNSVGIAHNPESNMKLASGVAPVPQLLAMDADVGLGTDGPASNNDQDMFHAMDFTAKLHKLNTLNPGVVSAQQVVQMATLGGAKVLNMADKIGSLEPGKRADFILVSMAPAHATPLFDPYSHLVYALKGGDVTTMVVEGRVLFHEGKVRTLDEPAVLAKARRIAREMVAQFHSD